ncbi:hypothetical protein SNEBB_001087 [Seison nebaliae]|nr:hypothetical protein SNEBB_001087 [Seison nebaliae]
MFKIKRYLYISLLIVFAIISLKKWESLGRLSSIESKRNDELTNKIESQRKLKTVNNLTVISIKIRKGEEFNECSDFIRKTNIVYNYQSNVYYSKGRLNENEELHRKYCRVEPAFTLSSRLLIVNENYFTTSNKFQFLYNETIWEELKGKIPRFICYFSFFDKCGRRKRNDKVGRITENTKIENMDGLNCDEEIVSLKCQNLLNRIKISRQLIKRQQLPHIILHSIDSIAAPHFQRAMTNSYKYFTGKLNATFFRHSIVVGQNTRPNMNALLAGLMSSFLTIYHNDTINRYEADASYFCRLHRHCDNLPFFWQLLPQSYLTVFQEDQPKIGMFHYLSAGFKQPIADVYFRPFYQTADPGKNHKCRSYSNFYGHIKQFFLILQNEAISQNASMLPVCHISAHKQYTHDNPIKAIIIDNQLMEFFKFLQYQNILDNSFFILNGDHGARLNSYSVSTTFGSIEKRRAMFGIRLPHKLIGSSYDVVLRENSNSIIGAFDMHHTIIEIINNFILKNNNVNYYNIYEKLYERNLKKEFFVRNKKFINIRNLTNIRQPRERGISLISKKLKYKRSCADLSAPNFYCICNEVPVKNVKNDIRHIFIQFVNELTPSVLNYLNDMVPSHLIESCRRYNNFEIERISISAVNLSKNKVEQYMGMLFLRVHIDNSPAIFSLNIYLEVHDKLVNITSTMTTESITFNIGQHIILSKISDNFERIDKYSTTSNCLANADLKYSKICLCFQ